MNISAVINVVEEEIQYLNTCLSSVEKLVDEIIVIDMTLSVDVYEISKKYNVKIFKHNRVSHVELVRNFGISKANGDWILILDPDEELPPTLLEKLRKIVSESKYDYVRIPRKNIIFKKWMQNSKWWPDYNIRFFKKGYVAWDERIHSVPLTKGLGTDLEVNEASAIKHNHYSNINQYLTRLIRYTDAQAQSAKGSYDYFDFVKKPLSEFMSRFFAESGYRDGIHGFVLSALQAFSELVVIVKIWEKGGFKESDINSKDIMRWSKHIFSEISYWVNDTIFKESGSLVSKIKRKFKLL